MKAHFVGPTRLVIDYLEPDEIEDLACMAHFIQVGTRETRALIEWLPEGCWTLAKILNQVVDDARMKGFLPPEPPVGSIASED